MKRTMLLVALLATLNKRRASVCGGLVICGVLVVVTVHALSVSSPISTEKELGRKAKLLETSCGGDWGYDGGGDSCAFQCFAGDRLHVWGHAGDPFGTPFGTFTASCGGVAVQCTDGGSFCEATSDETVQWDDEGLCTATGSGYGEYYCNAYVDGGSSKQAKLRVSFQLMGASFPR
jgi:hypothetical protein